MSDEHDEDAASEAHAARQDAFRDLVQTNADAYPTHALRGLNEALYVFSERGFLEGEGISQRDALLVWALVERVRLETFDVTLRM